jgi:excisionase family DNA binding protein
MDTDRLLLSIREAGALLGISPWTVRLYIVQGKIRPVRVGRRVLVEPDECRRFVESCKQSTQQVKRRPATAR